MSKESYIIKKANLENLLKSSPSGSFGLKKKTASNLFRYNQNDTKGKKSISIKDFDDIISIDLEHGILEVEGLTPYEKIVAFTLKHGFLPEVAPELKHITIGGAIVGIGIESTSYRFGFVHDGLLEAEVLLPNGEIIICQPKNEYADLFSALPNSYGTLGYILRAKIKLYPAKPFIHMKISKFSKTNEYISAMENATKDVNIQFIEGLVFSQNEQYLMTSFFVDHIPYHDDIYHNNIFYKLVKNKNDIYLSTDDYIFRYDPDWFWNIPENYTFNLLRRISPKFLRNSGYYKKYIQLKNKFRKKFGIDSAITKHDEILIQDWEVPWDKSADLLNFALKNINLEGKPWAIVPIRPIHFTTIYPLKINSLYFNLGCYSTSKRSSTDLFHNTKMMDKFCFSLNGVKMLYSSTFLSKEDFYKLYNGEYYKKIKLKYDPDYLSGELYDKVCYTQV